MNGNLHLTCLWTLFITQTGSAHGDPRFLERPEGASVVFPCLAEATATRPYGLYLRRGWLRPGDVLFLYTGSELSAGADADRSRLSVSGDPGDLAVNVTLSGLSAGDTDRYRCEFLVSNPSSEDERVPGRVDFFLLVAADVPGSLDIGLVQTCAGGSVMLPCLPPQREDLAVEGVTLKRKKGGAPVEMLYHSKNHQGSSSSSSSSSSSPSQFPAERVQLALVPGPGGITYNLTLKQLQPGDSALYSCQLLLRGRSDNIASLGRQKFFISVQGDGQHGCSGYPALLYALSSAAAVLFLLVLIGFVLMCKCKARYGVKSNPPAPVYEEMAGVKPFTQKLAPRHLEETEYRNCSLMKSCSENHYESPRGALHPRT